MEKTRPGRRNLLRAVVIAVVAVVAAVAIPGAASAEGPYDGVRLIWKNLDSNGQCLGVAGGDVTNGRPIILWGCNGNADQTWTAVSVYGGGSAPYVFHNGANPNKCLSVAGKSLNEFAGIVIWDCKPASDNQDQRWYTVSWRGATYVALQNYNSNLYLTAWYYGYQGYKVFQRSLTTGGGYSFNSFAAPW